MITHQEITINGTKDEIFTLSQDYALRLDWDPFLKEIKFLDNAKIAGQGVKVYVRSKNRLSMIIEYITIINSEYVSMRMIKGPKIFSRFSGTWSFTDTENGCLVKFRYKYTMRKVAVILSPFVHLMMNRDMKKRLKYLKIAVEKTDILKRLKYYT